MEINTVTIVLGILSSNIWNACGQEAKFNTTSPTSIKPIYPYQTIGFNTTGVKSGPVLVIDKKTLFVSNLRYPARQTANFWVGTGIPSSKGTLVPNEDGLSIPLHTYTSQNIYLQLPGNLTTGEIDYLAVFSTDKKNSIGHVALYANASDDVRKNIPEALGYHEKTKDNKRIFRVPKCTDLDVYLTKRSSDGATQYQHSKTEVEIDYRVYESNETHIDPDGFMKNIKLVPYKYELDCPEGMQRFGLEQTEALGLLYNSSLIYVFIDEHGIVPHGSFCMDNKNMNQTAVYMCLSDDGSFQKAAFPNLYLPLLIISAFCFFLSALCYVVILKAKDVHQKCFIGYTSSMTVTFLSLIFLQEMNSACTFIGDLFFVSLICSVAWLTCLCVDLIFLIRPVERLPDEKRIYYYIGFSLGTPLLFLIFSIAPDGKPDVPNSFIKMYSDSTCDFEDSSLYPLFMPIGLLILISLAGLCYTSYLISTKDDRRDFDWLRNKSNFKFMLRSRFLIWMTTCIWLMEVLVQLLTMVTVLKFAIDLIEASQGIIVMFIFVLNKYTRKDIMRSLKKGKKNYRVVTGLEMEANASVNTKDKRNATPDEIELIRMNNDGRKVSET